MTGLITMPPQGLPPDPAATAPAQPVESNTPPPLQTLPSLTREAEMKLVGSVREMFLRARDKKRPVVQQWRKNYKVLNKAVPAPGSDWRPNPNVPEIWPIVDALVAWMTDQDPHFDATPVTSPLNPRFAELAALADDLVTTMRASWHVDKCSAEVEKVVWDAMTYNIGYFKTVWDNSAYRGYGNAVMKRLDPWKMYPDPDASSMETANYFIEADTISWQELERRFPGAYERLNGNGWEEDIDVSPNKLGHNGAEMPKANSAAISPATTPRYGLPGQDGRVTVADDPGVTIFEAWLRMPKQNSMGGWYDTWKCVVVAGNRVLENAWAEDLWEHGQHPYDRYVCIESGEFYGACMVEMLAPMQNSINEILSNIEQNIALIGNPIFVEDTRAGVSRTAITNKPGSRLQKNAGGDANWMTPPTPYPGMATELIKFYIQEMERISGLSAVVRGASPSGRNAQGVIDAVQEAAFVRIRKALRNLSYTIGASGEKYASLIVEYYTDPRIVSILGSDGEKSTTYLKSNHFYLPTSDGPAPMRFQLLIDSGESQSQSRESRIAEADALYALGVIDEEAVLAVHQLPGWHTTLQRVRELKAQQGQLGQPPTQRAAARR